MLQQRKERVEERNRIHSGTPEPQPSARELANSCLAGELAAEGMVLLKNEGVLPMKVSTVTALFGCCAENTVKGGIGSGDVNNRESISVYRGLKEAGVVITSEDWLSDYQKCYESAKNKWKAKVLEDAEHVDNPFDAYVANPFVFPEGRRIADRDVEGAEAVIYVISRISGEGRDRRREDGDYYLSKREQEDILFLNRKDIPIVLILNTGGPVELTNILEEAENVRAVLSISQSGQESGRAAADILLGKKVPGGKLTTTWAKRYEDYPGAENFGYLNGNLETEEYTEGIYVGYRYFDSFGIQPLFPFGYGLSYTSFAMEFVRLQVKESKIEVEVLVKNTGDCYAGREVVQVYLTLPQTGEAKEYHRLAGFAKTPVLQTKEARKVTVTIEQKQMASFSEQLHAWYIEGGKYGVWIGNHSASLRLEAVLTVSERVILERTHVLCNGKVQFAELEGSKTAGEREADWMAMAEAQGIPEFLYVPGKEEQRVCRTQPAAELPVEELIPLLYGNITEGASTLGSSGVRVPGSAGETSEALEEKYGIRSLIMADGPAGLRLRQSYEVDRETDTVYGVGILGALENGFLEPAKHHEGADIYYQYCTAFPVGTALAQTWDPKLLQRFGEAVAAEMEEFQVDLWLAPGMNIHRNPLCGRNFEYYSEDPLLSGVMAAAVTEGVQSRKGCGVTIKHFACNNQEDNRQGVNVCVSERALREIYFRGFEIAVKQSAPAAIMSSYNLINGVHAANSRDLCTLTAREEWGFDGVIMSDWNTTVPDDGSVPWKCAAAGNDIIMPGSPKDDADIREAYAQGKLSEAEIRNCAGRILALIRKLDS